MSRQLLHRRGGYVPAKILLSCALAFSAMALAPNAIETLTPSSIQVVTSARADETVDACGPQIGPAGIFNGGSEAFGIKVGAYCSGGAYPITIATDGVNKIAPGATSSLIANAPAGLMISQATVPSMSLNQTVGSGYVAYMLWTGGEQRVDDSWYAYTIPFTRPGVNGFGFSLGCAGPSTCPVDDAFIYASNLQLNVVETVGPAFGFNPGSLWYEGSVGDSSGAPWIRGSWPLGFSASAPSGIQSLAASMSGETIGGPPAPTCAPVQTAWQQCPNGTNWTPTVTLSGAGQQQLDYSATSAAGNTSPADETIKVDTEQPTVTLSGAADASSSAGTQYVTATAHVGPSGLGALDCTVDGGPTQSYASSPAQVAVSGVGTHSISCTASNRSLNPAGQPAVPTPASFSMDIGAPTAGSISFGNIIHGLKCKKVTEREKIPAKWIKIRRHGKLVRVHRRAHTKRVKVMKCRERFVRRKVIELVKVKRHGKVVVVKRTKIEKVPVPPQAVSSSTKRVSYGKGATVSGILATTDGTALAGRTVQILTAPNNQLGQWSQAATIMTAPNGTWSATLPAGPSRLVEASYAGDTTTLPSTSNTVTLVVPARIKITITPHQLPWNGVLTLHGHLAGGYLPPDGVAMRVLIGLPHLAHPYLAQSFRTNAAGAFALKFKAFGGGHGVTRYPVWLATTSNESDYAYAKSSSRRIKITFGRRTPKKKRASHHSKHRKHKRSKRRR